MFDNPTNQILSIAVGDDGGALDPAFDLFDNDGNLVVSDDDSGPEDDALSVLTLPAGVYRVSVRGGAASGGRTTGTYTLSVVEGAIEPGVTMINFGQQVYGRVTTTMEIAEYGFYAEAGDRIAIRVSDKLALDQSGTSLDPFVELFGPDNFAIAEDDDSGPDDDAYLVLDSAPATGVYIIQVSNSPFASPAFNRFLLTLEGNVTNVRTISLGERFESDIASAGQVDSFEFNNDTGGDVWFVLDDYDPALAALGGGVGSALDPYLAILNSACVEVGSDNNSGPTDDAQLSTDLASGTADVSGGPDLSLGRYGLTYLAAQPAWPNLRDGDAQVDGTFRTEVFCFAGNPNDPGVYETFTLTLNAGETATIRFTDDGGVLNPAFRIDGPGGLRETVTKLPAGFRGQPNEDDAAIRVTAPGDYVIEAYGETLITARGAIELNIQ